ncbi:MAG TPA: hypothetical protein VHZ96_26295 [Frankiaceae bacterium]|jgi:hypothetical protein|nr:hypothetical protein [Frankiaceae bacterium]
MTTTDPAPVDPVRAFTAALPRAARDRLVLDYQTIPLIRAGSAKHGPAELARIVSAGIGRQNPANPGALVLFRLRREAGIDDDQEDDD